MDGVTLLDEAGSVGWEVWGVIFDETGGDGVFGGSEEDFAEGVLAGGAGGGGREGGEKSFSLIKIIVPICSSKVKISFNFAWRS